VTAPPPGMRDTIANAMLHAAQHELDVIAEEVEARADQDTQSADE